MDSNPKIKYILATDVGSTTTKARFFHRKDGEWRFLVAGEAPTTVESPYEDVTLGVINAVKEVEELTGHKLLLSDSSKIQVPFDGEKGVDIYCTTSSAGGGLQMMVTGVVKTMTAESANRGALGAGAIVMDILSVDSDRASYEKIQLIRDTRPDMILMSGGTDGGTIKHVVNMAQIIKAADPKPRLGVSYKLPIVYCGNINARPDIKDLLASEVALECIDNIRPVLERENLDPARRAIHELFMEHVMSHAPGYNKLMNWTEIDIMPTPAGEGLAIQLIAKKYNKNVIGVGLGGATTNVYSMYNERFVRSVSANLGMSYSICNVLKETGIDNITRWLPFEHDQSEVRNDLRNKMIRPTTIPHTLEELVIEHAVAREALRLGLEHHKSIATRLKGARTGSAFDRGITSQDMQETYIDMMNFDIVAGTGGLLSHAPRRAQSMLILSDAFQVEGVTELVQDSVFMMPHLGVLSTVRPDAAWEIFEKDCLIRLGTSIAPVGQTKALGETIMNVTMEMPNGNTVKESVKYGELKKIPLPENQIVKTVINPTNKFDVGMGRGKILTKDIGGGVVGVILDGRGRPLILPKEFQERRKILLSWFNALDLYPSIQSGEEY